MWYYAHLVVRFYQKELTERRKNAYGSKKLAVGSALVSLASSGVIISAYSDMRLWATSAVSAAAGVLSVWDMRKNEKRADDLCEKVLKMTCTEEFQKNKKRFQRFLYERGN